MPNINDFHRLYRRTKKSIGVTDETVRIPLGAVQPHVLRVLTHVTVENKSSDYDKCRLGISHGGRDHYIDELTTIVAGELAVSRSDILLAERDFLFAELTGTQTGDSLLLTCLGWEQDL